MKIKKFHFFVAVLILSISILLQGCGSQKGSDKNKGTQPSGDITAQQKSFLADYKAFVDKFCSTIEKAKKQPSLTQKMMQFGKIAPEAQKLAEYSEKYKQFQSSVTPAFEEAYKKVSQKGENCAQEMKKALGQ